MRSSTPLILAVLLLAASMSVTDARHEFIQVDADHEQPQRIRRARTRHLKAKAETKSTKDMKSTKAPKMKSTKAPKMKSYKATTADAQFKTLTSMFDEIEAKMEKTQMGLEEYLDADMMMSSMSMSMSMSM